MEERSLRVYDFGENIFLKANKYINKNNYTNTSRNK